MNRARLMLASALVLAVVGVSALTPRSSAQFSQLKGQGTRYEYKVSVFSYNAGDRLSDAQRATAFERELNKQAESGWEFVGSALSRDNVETAGGGVSTSRTVSFVTYRRAR